MTIEQAAQHPEVRLYSPQGNAHSAYPNEASFYGHLGNASGVYPNGMQDTPQQEAYLYGRPDNAYSTYPNSVQHLSPDARMEVNRVLLEQQQAGGNQPEEEKRQMTSQSPVQFFDGVIPGSAVA